MMAHFSLPNLLVSRSEVPIGEVFGHLTVLAPGVHRGKAAHWICLCTCGKTKEINAANIKSGSTKSCGCARGRTGKRPDPIGTRQGMLVAVSRHLDNNQKVVCKCDCGRSRLVNVGHFNAGSVYSCGCTKRLGATPPTTCKFEGCDDVACNSHGWCWMHYYRIRRHGDPSYTENGKPQEWLLAHVDFDGEACLTWPFGARDNGYGTMVFDGAHVSAHRKMCELANGPPPSSEHEAAHDCGRGHLGCVNPTHLLWKTPTENAADKIGHGTSLRGTKNHRAKLNSRQVLAIREEYARGGTSYARLAEKYGVSTGAIASIVRRENWAWL